jgi:hypothetical protein
VSGEGKAGSYTSPKCSAPLRTDHAHSSEEGQALFIRPLEVTQGHSDICCTCEIHGGFGRPEFEDLVHQRGTKHHISNFVSISH